MKSRIKGHNKVNEELIYFLEPNNKYSKNAIIANSNEIIVEHVLEALVEKSFSLMKQRNLYKVKVKCNVRNVRPPI